jgi:hypothetical protein
MPMGKGTYGSKRGRPPKKSGKRKMTKAQVVKMIKNKARKKKK